MSNRLPFLLALFAAGACATPPPLTTSPAAPSAAAPPAAFAHTAIVPPAGLRLPRTATPSRYAATLTVVPSSDTVEGEIDIDVTLSEPTSVLWLHALELDVREAHLEVSGKRLAARAVPRETDLLGFALEAPAPAGPARLHVVYQGKVSSSADRGVFKEEEDGERYIYSQFENTEARRAFPCFDEPSFKVPWQLTLRVRQGDTALSNTPAISESPVSGGMKLVRFAETKPLPSYLIAFAVGPFTTVDAGKAGKNGTPLRIVTPKGRQAEVAYAVAATPSIFAEVEGYFGIPYPYEKLDVVAVPRLSSFAAMENAGLVTFFQQGMLAKPHEDTIAFKRRYSVIVAHEIAHQWFGDLVTMPWWDDIWLNEAFASWMETKIMSQWKPEWLWEVERQETASSAMEGDSLVSARRIRQRVDSYDDIENAFDGITYDKGAAVITMFESWLEPEKFRKGVQRHLREHAFSTATSSDFLASISAEVGRDVGPAFATFLDQPGVPLIKADLRCDKGAKPRLELTQERYLPAGSQGATAAQTWQVPICARYGAGAASGRACTLLTERTGTLELGEMSRGSAPSAPGGQSRCPEWVLPNEGGTGYYHVAYQAESLNRLLRGGGQQLTVPERIALIRDVRALMSSGKLPVADALARLPDLAKDPSPHVLHSAVATLSTLPDPLFPEALRPNFARFVQRTFGAKARALGWLPKPGEAEPLRLLRPLLVSLVADRGQDKALAAEAASLTERWLNDPGGLAPDVVGPILSAAAHNGDRKLFERMHAEAKKAKDQNRRTSLLRAMGGFRDPAIVNDALAILLTDEFDQRDAINLFFQDDRMAGVVFAFYKQNYDALMAKLPDNIRGDTLNIANPLCDAPQRADAEAFFKGRAEKLTGGPRTMAQVLERISLCSALREAHQASVTAFLKKY